MQFNRNFLFNFSYICLTIKTITFEVERALILADWFRSSSPLLGHFQVVFAARTTGKNYRLYFDVSKLLPKRDVLRPVRPQKYPLPHAASQDKLKPLYRTTNVTGNNKVFDKDLKSISMPTSAFVLEFTSANSKMHLPRDDKSSLYLIQQYLVLQIYLTSGMPWSIELVISDLTKVQFS
jgi:hypothetical protein